MGLSVSFVPGYMKQLKGVRIELPAGSCCVRSRPERLFNIHFKQVLRFVKLLLLHHKKCEVVHDDFG